jgi:hypothetical protein
LKELCYLYFKLSFMRILAYNILIIILLPIYLHAQAPDSTYAERLGFPKGSRVLILHVDDAGMSFDSNEGAEMALTKGGINLGQRHDALPLGARICSFFENTP